MLLRDESKTYEEDCSKRVVHTTLNLAVASHGKFEIWDPVDLVLTFGLAEINCLDSGRVAHT